MTLPAALPPLDVDLTPDGALRLRWHERALGSIAAHVVVRVGGMLATLDLLRDGTVERTSEAGAVHVAIRTAHPGLTARWQVQARADSPWLRLQVVLEAGQTPVTVEDIQPLTVPWTETPIAPERAAARWWIVPPNGWDRPGTRPLAGCALPDDCPSVAYDIGAAFTPAGAAVTVGHVLPTRWMNRLDADASHLCVRSHVGVTIPAGGTLTSDPLLLDVTRPVIEALLSLRDQHHGRRLVEESAAHWGWNTWDFFTDKLTEPDIAEAILAIQAHPWIRERVRYLIIDDSWQQGTGDWQTGQRFGDIQRAATTIAAAGFIPGIWTAPFFADKHSELVQRHPEMVLRLADGQQYGHCMGCDPPWGDRVYLDPTHPLVPEHLFQLYRRLAQWGFGYYKTDFLHNPISPMFPGDQVKFREQIRFHNPGLGLVRAHRTCMEAIRAAIGPDAFWLGCGTHYASGAGLMDATRISGDMRVYYPNLMLCARSAIFDFHLHGGPFLIDPDFAVVRGRETAGPGGLELPPMGTKPYVRQQGDSGPTFSRSDAQLWAAVLIMSGGMITLSDRLDRLNEAGLAILRVLLTHGGGPSAVPHDLFAPIPQVWVKRHQGTTYVLLVNWDDHGHASIALPPAVPAGAVCEDLWGGPDVTVGPAPLAIAPHAHRLLRVRL